MKSAQEIFDRMQEVKVEQRELRRAYKDTLDNMTDYRELVDQYNKARDKKLSIEHKVKQDSANEFAKLETMKMNLKSDQEMLSDIALTTMMKGEQVEITDQHQNEYEPVFSVKFKKRT
ncbi:MAG: hypothetical protein O2794_00550 [bacterium]|nr:hypothetical protein [bacterium]